MAINKKLIHFKNKETFENQLSEGNILDTSLCFIQDTKEIYTHGTIYCYNKWNNILTDNGDGTKYLANDGTYKGLLLNQSLQFYCIEPVTVIVNQEATEYSANSNVNIFLNKDDEFVIIPTSDNSIQTLSAYPGALGEFYPWLEGVQLFSNILFDMNDLAMYEKWNQGHQGQYHVQFAQYTNCIFWSDNAYVSDVAKRTNYTLYYSSQLPLCYSTIPDNTFKAFYCAYGVTNDPNWSNSTYKESFAKATWATQVFSYYGARSIGMYDMDASYFNITLPKDCRGLMFYAPAIRNAGIFDAINVTNFGAKSGSWRDAFAYCHSLETLYIKNLTVNINISWSPISQESLDYILSNAANTKKITISLSPYTYYRLTESNKTLAANKNITLELITTNYVDDNRLSLIKTNGDGSQFLANDGSYKTISNNLSTFNNDAGFITDIPEDYITKSEVEEEVNNAISELIDSAPETLDTLGEIATALNNNTGVIDILNQAIANKSDKGHTHDDRYYTKEEVLEIVAKMYEEILKIIDFSTNSSEPEEPETPEEPVVETLGEITEDNTITINENLLSEGTYTLKYLDSSDNVISNFKPLGEFEI